MDPEMCLLNAKLYIMDGDDEHAAQALDNYVNWRGKGGFEPEMPLDSHRLMNIDPIFIKGDVFHQALIKSFERKFGPYLDGRLPE